MGVGCIAEVSQPMSGVAVLEKLACAASEVAAPHGEPILFASVLLLLRRSRCSSNLSKLSDENSLSDGGRLEDRLDIKGVSRRAMAKKVFSSTSLHSSSDKSLCSRSR